MPLQSSPSFSLLPLSLSLSVRTPPLPFFFQISVCILHLYSLPSLQTEVGKLPSAGASSRCSLFLSSLPLFLSPYPPSLFPRSTSVHSALSDFFSPSHSFCVSQWRQLREAAVFASASHFPQVKAAASSDAANSKRGEEVCGFFTAVTAGSRPGTGHTFLIVFKKRKKASRRKGQAEDPSNQTNKSQADWKERREENDNQSTDSAGHRFLKKKQQKKTHYSLLFFYFLLSPAF